MAFEFLNDIFKALEEDTPPMTPEQQEIFDNYVKIQTDGLLYGEAFIRVTPQGIKHVPREEVNNGVQKEGVRFTLQARTGKSQKNNE